VVHLRHEPLSDAAEALRQMIIVHGERMIGGPSAHAQIEEAVAAEGQ
jgi:hypothetical protein